MTTNQGEGTLDKKEEKTTSTGRSYIKATIGGKAMSAWAGAATAIKEVPLGTYLKYTSETNEQGFTSLKGFTTATPAKGGNDKDRSITKAVAFKGAVDLACAIIAKGDTKIEADKFVISLSNIFNDYLLSNDEEEEPPMGTEEEVQ